MATARNQVYKCGVCGNMVEVVDASAGTLVCCGQDMNLLAENTTDAAQEKHVPVIEKTDAGIKVTVGSVAHPMEEKHYIQFIELVCEHGVVRKYLKPGEAPEAVFDCGCSEGFSAREHCNLHGLWKAESA